MTRSIDKATDEDRLNPRPTVDEANPTGRAPAAPAVDADGNVIPPRQTPPPVPPLEYNPQGGTVQPRTPEPQGNTYESGTVRDPQGNVVTPDTSQRMGPPAPDVPVPGDTYERMNPPPIVSEGVPVPGAVRQPGVPPSWTSRALGGISRDASIANILRSLEQGARGVARVVR